MNDGLERMQKKAVVAYSKIVSSHFLGGAEENHKRPQSG
jgi:hypothetical protein